MLLIQQFLNGFCIDNPAENAFKYLKDFYGVYASRHPEFPELVQFSYDLYDWRR